jgi:hypothetical protein
MWFPSYIGETSVIVQNARLEGFRLVLNVTPHDGAHHEVTWLDPGEKAEVTITGPSGRFIELDEPENWHEAALWIHAHGGASITMGLGSPPTGTYPPNRITEGWPFGQPPEGETRLGLYLSRGAAVVHDREAARIEFGRRRNGEAVVWVDVALAGGSVPQLDATSDGFVLTGAAEPRMSRSLRTAR